MGMVQEVKFTKLIDTLFKEDISFFVDKELIESMCVDNGYPVLIDDNGKEYIIESAELSDTMVNVDGIKLTTDKGEAQLTFVLHYIIKFHDNKCSILPILNNWLISLNRTMNKRGQNLLFSDFDNIIMFRDDDSVECIIGEDGKAQPFYVTSIEADDKGDLKWVEGYSESGDFIRDTVLFDSVEVNAPTIYADEHQEEINEIKALLESGCLIIGERESEYTGYMYSPQIILDCDGKVIYARHNLDTLAMVDLRFVDNISIAFGIITITIDDADIVFNVYQKKED